MSESAFGIEHTEISKAEKKQPKASAGRLAAGATFGWAHGAVAGKPGHKLKAMGNQAVGGLAGGAAGAVAGGRYGQLAGTAGGSLAGTVRAQKKGHFNNKQGVKKSAFDVNHDVSKMIRVGAAAQPGLGSSAAAARKATAARFKPGAHGKPAPAAAAAPAAAGGARATRPGARKAAPTGLRANLRPMASQYKKELGVAGGVTAAGGAGLYGMNRKNR